jgi:hypothetical protein
MFKNKKYRYKKSKFYAESFGKVAKSLLKRNYRAVHNTVHTALKDENHKFLISYANVGEVNPPKVSGLLYCMYLRLGRQEVYKVTRLQQF